MAPAHQGFGPDHLAGAQVHLRLVAEHQFVVADGAAQACLQHQVLVHDLVQLRRIELGIVLAQGLGVVHGGIGGAHHAVDAVAVEREQADADAGAGHDFAAGHVDRRAHAAADALDQVGHTLGAGLVVDHQHELVAADARDRVVFAHVRFQAAGNFLQHHVAGFVAEVVVDVLEVVEVEKGQRTQHPIFQRMVDRLLQLVLQQGAVGQAGERVVVRQVVQAALVIARFGDVVDHRHEMRHLAIDVRHRVDAQVVPEHFAILACVAQHRAHAFLVHERIVDALVFRHVAAFDAHEARVAALDFRQRVAGNLLEGGVDVFDLVVAAFAAGDQDRVHAREHRALAHPQPLLGALACLDVEPGAEYAGQAAQAGARAMEQEGGALAVLADQFGFVRGTAVVERVQDLLHDHGPLFFVEEELDVTRRQLLARHFQRFFELVVPQQQVAALVDHIEHAGQAFDDVGHRQVLDQRIARRAMAIARNDDHAVGAGLARIVGLRRHRHADRQAVAVGAQQEADRFGIGARRHRHAVAGVVELDHAVQGLVADVRRRVASEHFAGPVPARDDAGGVDHEDGKGQG